MSGWIRGRVAAESAAAPRTGILSWLLALSAIGSVATGCTVRTSLPVSYAIVEEQTLRVQVLDGPNEHCVLVSTEETPTEVRVRVECERPVFSVGSTGAGYLYDFDVPLSAPLADRTVVDGQGLPATRCSALPC